MKRLVKTYAKYCRQPTVMRRQEVLRQAKDLESLMKLAPRRAAAVAGGFAGATLDGLNNNLRLLVDAMRTVADGVNDLVRLLLTCEAHD